MYTQKVKINVNGKEEFGTPVDITKSKEHFNEIHLSDGSILKMKLVVSSVIRLDSQKDQFGNPIYVVKSTNVVDVSRGPSPSLSKMRH